jgi:hypothetical protein
VGYFHSASGGRIPEEPFRHVGWLRGVGKGGEQGIITRVALAPDSSSLSLSLFAALHRCCFHQPFVFSVVFNV